jgi:hypothetical protein
MSLQDKKKKKKKVYAASASLAPVRCRGSLLCSFTLFVSLWDLGGSSFVFFGFCGGE